MVHANVGCGDGMGFADVGKWKSKNVFYFAWVGNEFGLGLTIKYVWIDQKATHGYKHA